jgi:predicted regulator of Ras-like GTPase activity (Roadblock/LC7/MglB family)
MIYFEDGEIVHAECEGRIGENALYTILGWEGGDFTTISGADPSTTTINRPWQELLIEAMRRKDEEQSTGNGNNEPVNLVDSEDTDLNLDPAGAMDESTFDNEIELPPASPKAQPSTPEDIDFNRDSAQKQSRSTVPNIPKDDIGEPRIQQVKTAKDKAAVIKRALVEWQRNTEEIQGAAVVTLDGLNLAAHVGQGEITGEQLSALTASIFKVGNKSVNALRRGPLEELYLRGNQGTIYLYVIDSRTILSVLARSDANMGVVHIESREQCKRVAQILGI